MTTVTKSNLSYLRDLVLGAVEAIYDGDEDHACELLIEVLIASGSDPAPYREDYPRAVEYGELHVFV